MNALKVNLLSLFVLALLTQNLRAQDWPQWRGPNRDGHVEKFSLPAAWPDSLKRVWRVEVGAGLSSPVIADGKIYLLTRNGDDEVVSCYRLTDGSRAWQQRYAAPFIPNPQTTFTRFFPLSKGKGPFATPVLHRERLYAIGVDRVLSCFDAKSNNSHCMAYRGLVRDRFKGYREDQNIQKAKIEDNVNGKLGKNSYHWGCSESRLWDPYGVLSC